jgi:hypothetical protein
MWQQSLCRGNRWESLRSLLGESFAATRRPPQGIRRRVGGVTRTLLKMFKPNKEMRHRIPSTQPSPERTREGGSIVARGFPPNATRVFVPSSRVCVYRGRDGALRRPRRVQRRNERTIDFTASIPRLNGAGTAQRAVPTTRSFGYAKQVPSRRDETPMPGRLGSLRYGGQKWLRYAH